MSEATKELELITNTDIFQFSFSADDIPASSLNILQQAPPPFRNIAAISSLFSSTYYVNSDQRVNDIVDCLNEFASLLSIGVVDSKNRPVGVIVRREIFNILGKSYGKTLIENQTASQIMRETKCFSDSENIHAVSSTLQEEMNDEQILYFSAVNKKGEFSGVFSTRDLLNHLASMNRKDLATAQMIQTRIVNKDQHLSNDDFELTCHSTMALGIGGDFYKIKEYGKSRYHLSIADVSGKGMPASLITAVACGMQTSYDFSKGLKGFVRDLNDYIFDTFNSEKFITGIFSDIDSKRKKIKLCDMGHSLLYFIRNGHFASLKGHEINIPLGISYIDNYNTSSIRCQSGDILFIATDGISEQIDDNGMQYGEERLKELLGSLKDEPIQEISRKVREDVSRFKGNQPQKDDLTFLVLKWK